MFRDSRKAHSSSERETIEIGENLAGDLVDGDVIVLTGPLGAGKTVFIKGLARGIGIAEDWVKSPSYTLVNEYQGKWTLYHFDLYRMNDLEELYHIGWDDYLLRDGIVVVEWGEKADGLLPNNVIKINIAIVSDNERDIDIRFAQ